MKYTMIIALVCLMAPFAVSDAHAREFRVLNAIPAPKQLPTGAQAAENAPPVNPKIVQKAVRQIAASWNTQDLAKHLGEDFHDKERLGDNIQSFIPRDAKLNILSIQGQQTLQQYEQDGKLVSRVSVVVNTQVEFNHPTAGFQRFPGRTELVFKVKQRL